MGASPPAIAAEHVVKRFGSTVAVDDASVDVADGEIVAVLGPSGSGKTTMLRVVAGFEQPDGGEVWIGGRQVAGDGAWVEPDQRRVGMVFQDGALFPHLTVSENIEFGKPSAGVASRCLDLVGLSDRAGAHPHELSGGERQRIALARALAIEPDVVLLDEPFASLDAALRVSLRTDVAEILRSAGTSALLVTHDQDEAFAVADRIVVMHDGTVEQTGAPEEIYDTPATRWVAEFLGAANVVPGDLSEGFVDCELGRLPARVRHRSDLLSGTRRVDVIVRPEAIVATAEASDVDGIPSCPARVVSRSFQGGDVLLGVQLPSGARLEARMHGRERWANGDDVHVRVAGDVAVVSAA
ncbi:MAG: ABC transporter ATP-binding protein [Actinomycetota bacterium]